jgi:hypothetical protein
MNVYFSRHGTLMAVADSPDEATRLLDARLRAGYLPGALSVDTGLAVEWVEQAQDERLVLWFTQGAERSFQSIAPADHVKSTRYEKSLGEWARVLGKGIGPILCPFIAGDERAVPWQAAQMRGVVAENDRLEALARATKPEIRSAAPAKEDPRALLQELIEHAEAPLGERDEWLMAFAERARAALA